MGVDIRLRVPPLHSRPSYPNLFLLAVNGFGRSGRSRGTSTTQARFHAILLILVLDPKRCPLDIERAILPAAIRYTGTRKPHALDSTHSCCG